MTRRQGRRRIGRAGGAWAGRLGVGLVALLAVSCSQSANSVPLRSLEKSGKIALLCLDLGSVAADPSKPPPLGYSLEDCQAQRLANKTGGSDTHRVDPAVGVPVKLYALVNQTTRGEVALLDIPDTTVIDTDATSPGFNFLPVGAEPVDVVVTPESTAAFVASADDIRPGIFAIPTNKILGAPSLLSWPACSLPAAPGAMTMLVAPDAGLCGGANYAVDTLHETRDQEHPNGDLSTEQQRPGARKLLVTLPTEGEMLVIDAQALLDRTPGSFETCPIERRYQLASQAPDAVTLTGEPDPDDVCPVRPSSTSSPVCPVRQPQTTSYTPTSRSQPVAVAQVDGQVYLADRLAPVIHHYDMTDPCNPVQLPPLLPSSFDEPWRQVTTRSLAVSPVTSDNRRFLYAVDDYDQGSAMIFDVSPQGGARTPVVRSRPEYFPFSPRDRLNLGAPIQDISFVQQDFYPYDSNGTKVPGIKCDPDHTDTPGATYHLSADFTTGALPERLRGIFAVVALSNGLIEIVDVDDYDAACRRPNNATTIPDWVSGCDTTPVSLDDCRDPAKACVCQPSLSPYTDEESTCRAIVRHEVRSRNLIRTTSTLGRHDPSMGTLPQLSLDGVTLATDADTNPDAALYPKLLGPLNDRSNDGRWTFTSDGVTEFGTGDPVPRTATNNFVIADLREPRAAIDQNWTLVYEGALSNTINRVGTLHVDSAVGSQRLFNDSAGGGNCYLGLHDEAMARLELSRLQPGRDKALLDADARTHADWLEITSELPGEDDPYWTDPELSCSYLRCRVTFGTTEEPAPSRSFRIQKAYDNRLLLRRDDETPDADGNYKTPLLVDDLTSKGATLQPTCCFPQQVTYQVRGGQTWIANGSALGFLHHTTPAADGSCTLLGVDPGTGVTCDESFLTNTGRAYEIADVGGRSLTARPHTDPQLFKNPYFSAFIYKGSSPSRRDMAFSWTMVGGFQPLSLDVGRGSAQVSPQSLVYHPALGSEILVTDASLQGVLSVDLFSFVVSRNFL